MPIYEFRCKTCTRSFESMRTFSRKDDPASCPECGSTETMRLLSLMASPISSRAAAGCETSMALGTTCCGGGCGLPTRR